MKNEIILDWVFSDTDDEIVISIKTSDGRPLSAQDSLDAVTVMVSEEYNHNIIPLSKSDIEKDPSIH